MRDGVELGLRGKREGERNRRQPRQRLTALNPEVAEKGRKVRGLEKLRTADRHKVPCLRNTEKEMLAKSLLGQSSERERKK